MKKIPYLLIGLGQMTHHFSHYFQLKQIPFQIWHYRFGSTLEEIIEPHQRVLLLIKDSAIEPFIKQHPILKDKICIHCSGALSTPLAYGAHPLMTFSKQLYSLETYERIPFILEDRSSSFEELLPGLSNPHCLIPSSMKAYYHSLCVMAGNFTTLLWQKFFDEAENRLHIPKEYIYLYMETIIENLKQDASSALTGPLARSDYQTIQKNLNALAKDPYQKIYQAFIEMYETNQGKQHEYP